MAMLFGRTQEEMAKLVRTDSKGTADYDVCSWLTKAGVKHHMVRFHDRIEYKDLWWIEPLSRKHPLYLGCEIRSRYCTAGRDQVRQHAVLAVDGMFYDPGLNDPQPYEAYISSFNKSLHLKAMILIDQERKGYLNEKEA